MLLQGLSPSSLSCSSPSCLSNWKGLKIPYVVQTDQSECFMLTDRSTGQLPSQLENLCWLGKSMDCITQCHKTNQSSSRSPRPLLKIKKIKNWSMFLIDLNFQADRPIRHGDMNFWINPSTTKSTIMSDGTTMLNISVQGTLTLPTMLTTTHCYPHINVIFET